MLDIIKIKNLLEEKFNKVQFIKIIDETKYVYEHVIGEYNGNDEYATIIIDTEDCECEEDAVVSFTSEHVTIGMYTEEFDGEPTEYIVNHISRKFIDMKEREWEYEDVNVKTYKRSNPAVKFAEKFAKERNISFNGMVWYC